MRNLSQRICGILLVLAILFGTLSVCTGSTYAIAEFDNETEESAAAEDVETLASPEVTEESAASSPTPSPSPEVSEEPTQSIVPEEASSPTPSPSPEASEEPTESIVPEETPAPVPSISPEVSEEPKESAVPEETPVPTPSPSPEVSEEPKESVVPEETVLEETAAQILPTALTVKTASISIGLYETYSIADLWAFEPENAQDEVRYSTGNSKYVAVNSSGQVYGRRRGSATITVTAASGASCKIKVTVKKAPTSVKGTASRYTLSVGETMQLGHRLSNGAAGTVKFESMNPSVATITEDGVLTAVSTGKAKITVSTYNGKSASGTFTIVAAPTEVILNKEAVSIGVGDKWTLSASLNKGTYGSISYASADESIATIDQNGKITAVSEGETVVTATAYNGISKDCIVTVVPEPTEIILTAETTVLGVNEKMQLDASMLPGDTVRTLTYKSSNSKYVSVSSTGVVTAKRTGSATITATAYNGIKATIKITVKKAPSKVTLKPQMKVFSVGQTQNVSVKLNGYGHWTLSSSNTGVISIDESNRLHAVAPGRAKISVTTYNGKKSSYTITVVPAPTNVYAPKGSLSVVEGKQISAKFTVNSGSYTDFTYSSADPDIATVNERGVVTGVHRGETEIIATTHNGLSIGARICVLPTPDEIVFPQESLTLGLGGVYALDFSPVPENAVGIYNYSSSDSGIVSVNADGLLSCKALGKAIITVTAQNGTTAGIAITVDEYANVHDALCVAHRGASAYREDNTLESFRYAAELGADEVELDVRKTKDGYLVLCHDATVVYAGKKRSISKLTLAQLKTVLPDVCTLEEALTYLSTTDMNVQIEIKVGSIESAVLQCVSDSGMVERAKYGSFDYSVVKKIRKLQPDAYVVYIISSGKTLKKVLKTPSAYKANAISLSCSNTSPSTVFKLHQAGKKVAVWTVNTRELIEKYRAMGVDSIITNYPDYF